jgi:hypothetical protein
VKNLINREKDTPLCAVIGFYKTDARRQKTGSPSENLPCLQTAFCVAEKMGEELGRG